MYFLSVCVIHFISENYKNAYFFLAKEENEVSLHFFENTFMNKRLCHHITQTRLSHGCLQQTSCVKRLSALSARGAIMNYLMLLVFTRRLPQTSIAKSLSCDLKRLGLLFHILLYFLLFFY